VVEDPTLVTNKNKYT